MRSELTKQKIMKALMALMKTTPLDKISVSDIAKKAKVSRQTFYYHFSCMYDIFDWFMKNSIPHPNGIGTGVNAPSPSVCVVELCGVFKANREFVLEYRRVYRDDFADRIRCFIAKAVHDNLHYVFPGSVSKGDLDVLTRFVTDGFVGVITRWFKSDMQIDIKEVFRGINTALTIGVPDDVLGKVIANIPSESFDPVRQ